jgi:hypothetical protein
LPGPILHDAAIAGRALPEAAVGSMPFVVLDVLTQELFQLPVVPDQGAVEELPANGADPAFRVRVRDLWVPETRPGVLTWGFALALIGVNLSAARIGAWPASTVLSGS